MNPKIPTITDDEIRAWFTETKHKRPWLAALLSAKPGSVDQWFSKGFPDWAKTIIALYRENQSNPNLLQPQTRQPTYEPFLSIVWFSAARPRDLDSAPTYS